MPAGILTALLLLVLFAVVFRTSFSPSQVLFANDGPLGLLMSDALKLPAAYAGIWSNLNWLGSPGGHAPVGFTYPLLWALGPIGFAKFYVPLTQVILGMCAWYFFRRLRFDPVVCALAALAAALNSNFFSNACWGLATRGLSLAAVFLALAAVQSTFSARSLVDSLVKTVLAGLAIGLSICEGGDNGAIFSLFIAGYAFFGSLNREGPVGRRIATGGAKVALMAVAATLMAAQMLFTFVSKEVKATTAEQQGWRGEAQWDWATQWSLPKAESLRVVVPGLFGYRLDTPNGGNYWGSVGQQPGWKDGHKDPAWVESHPGAFPRHSGAGEYAGVLVALIALWALYHSLIPGGIFNTQERRMIWFWSCAALIALLLSWGRHAPFYQFLYSLPYFSTIRNPMKFMHPFHMVLMILFAYGLQGIWRRYMKPAAQDAMKVKPRAGSALEKRWWIGSWAFLALSLVGWILYASSSTGMIRYLGDVGFDPAQAKQIAKFSAAEVGWSVFFLVASMVTLFFITKGTFSGGRATWAGVLLGLVLVADLSRANAPWIRHYDYKEKYADNGLLKILSTQPYKHRMAMPPLQWDSNYSILQQVYAVEWLQHQFQYYNIQSIDQPQEPRMPADKAAYRSALSTNLIRLWELTNTRFLGGMKGNFVDALNRDLDPVQRRFKLHTTFSMFQSPTTGVIGARIDEQGPFGLVEFTGALPRASLYSQWQVLPDDQAVLDRLADPQFDPHKEVLLSDPIPAAESSASVAASDSVEFLNYSPKRIELEATASQPSVLLLNDKIDPGWRAWVDDEPATILRCNFMMRGVQVPPGKHSVTFRYQPVSTAFYTTFVVTVVGVLLCGFLMVAGHSAARKSTATPQKP